MTVDSDRSGLAGLLGAELCPAGLPVITAAMLKDSRALAVMRQAGAMHYVNMGGREPGWIVTDYDLAAKVLVDPGLMGEPPHASSKRTRPEEQLDEEDLFFLPEERHARLRRMITRPLTHRRVAALAPRIQGEVDRLLDELPASGPVDFTTLFARPLPVAVLCELLGVPESGRRFIREYVFGWVPTSHDATPVTDAAGIAMTAYLKELIAARKADPQEDLISAMAQTDGADTPELDVLSAVRLLLVAGHRPVTTLLNHGVATLLLQRERWQRLVGDPSLIDGAVEELLRVVTPTGLSSRYVKADTEIDGFVLPEGTGVHCALAAANRDPARFDDPEWFDPRRPANPHLAFGLGRKHCLGAPLARAEAVIAISSLLRRFPGLRIADENWAGRRLTVFLGPA